MSPPRVLWLTKGLGRGGAERLITLLGRQIDRDRFDVEVAYLLPWKDAFVAELEAQGIPTHCLGGGRLGGVAWVPRLRRLARRRGYRLVHTHSPLPAVGARLGLPRSVAFVHTEHNVWDRYRWPTRVVNMVTYQRNAVVLGVSNGVTASIRVPRALPGPPPHVETLYHGIDDDLVRHGPEAAARARRLLGVGPDEPVVGTVANFTPKKDQRTLLRAIELLVADVPDVRVVLIGTGPLEGALKAQAAAAGLGDQVLFTGIRDDVQELLPGFDVFVLSSLHEGLSIALIEALAAGVPCVATRVGGVGEVVQDGVDGLLIPPGDPHVLATALGKVLLDPELRASLGAAGKENARRFTISTAVERIETVYDQLLASP